MSQADSEIRPPGRHPGYVLQGFSGRRRFINDYKKFAVLHFGANFISQVIVIDDVYDE